MVDGYRDSTSKEYYVFDLHKIILYTCALFYVGLSVVVMVLQPFLTLDCQPVVPYEQQHVTFHNPQYVYNPCDNVREWKLLGLTIDECSTGRRLIWAVIFGCFIGWERRNADRPAGIRTMALVSLGSCLFSICSTFAFLTGPMAWDSSRVSAAIPSGVGFLGSALIFKHTTNEEKAWHEVHGLTTAASVWLSAAVGIACAGELYFVASLTTALVLVMLRFGPRTKYFDFEDDEDVELGEVADDGHHSIMNLRNYNTTTTPPRPPTTIDPEMQRIIPPSSNGKNTISSLSRATMSRRSMRPSLM